MTAYAVLEIPIIATHEAPLGAVAISLKALPLWERLGGGISDNNDLWCKMVSPTQTLLPKGEGFKRQ